MTGETRPPVPQPPPGSSQEPARPPCAISFLEALDEDSAPLQKRSFDIAMALAQQKQNRNCAECLGRIGVSVCPLLLYPAPKAQLIEDIRDNKVVEVQIRRGLKGEATAEAPRPLLNKTLNLLGLPTLPQDDSPSPQPDINPEPTKEVGQPVDLSEPETRPPCAPKLAQFFKLRKKAIADWRTHNIGKGKKKGEWEPSSTYHRHNEEIYREAIHLTSQAKEEDCSKCLGKDCPIRNGVPPKTLYDSTSRESEIRIEPEEPLKKLKTSKYIIRILLGESRLNFNPAILDKIAEKLAKRVKEKGGTYSDEAT